MTQNPQEMNTQDVAKSLLVTFPGHPEKHIVQTGMDESGKKRISTVQRRADLQAVRRHLHVDARSGKGVLGVYPGIRSGSVWRTPWAMLDFDNSKPDMLDTYFALLQRRGMKFSFNTGSTGRGTHLWFLLDQAITLQQAFQSLSFLKRVAQEMGHQHIDLRPSSPTPDGAAVLLPYRGAGPNRFGSQGAALCNFETGEIVEVACLGDLPRQSAQGFARLGRKGRSVKRFIDGDAPPPPPQLPRLPSVLGAEAASPQERWTAELERLEPLWEEGRRHHLMLAVTAYGVRIGIDAAQIERDVSALMVEAGDEEATARRAGIAEQLQKAEEGQSLAYRPYYQSAEVAPPVNPPAAEVREGVVGLLAALMERPWKRGKSARSLLKAMLRFAWAHGVLHPQGIEVSVAWAQLWQEAQIGSPSTVANGLAPLEQEGWVRRATIPADGNSGSFILLVTNKSTPSTSPQGGIEEYFGLSLSLRYGQGRLGKSAEQVLDMLRWYGPQTIQQLAGLMATRTQDLKRHVMRLSNAGIVTHPYSGWSEPLDLTSTWRECLNDHVERDGSNRAMKAQIALQEEKRRRYRRTLKRQALASPPTSP